MLSHELLQNADGKPNRQLQARKQTQRRRKASIFVRFALLFWWSFRLGLDSIHSDGEYRRVMPAFVKGGQ